MRLAWPIWSGRNAATPRLLAPSRVALAARAAYAAQASHAGADRWAPWLWGDDTATQARTPFDAKFAAKRAHAWQGIDATLADLLAS